jgi:hypothetical protein
MFYRIQSLYLGLAFLFAAANIRFVPYWKLSYHQVTTPDVSRDILLYGFEIHGRMGLVQGLFFAVAVLAVVAAGLAAVSLVLFTKRPLQKTLAFIGSLVALMLTGVSISSGLLYGTELMALNRVSGTVSVAPSAGLFLMASASVLFFVAGRAIAADENLVRSVDRVR